MNIKDQKRFKTKYTQLDAEQCWLWQGYCEPKMGYGRFVWKTEDDKVEQYAHRFAFLMHYQFLPQKPITVDHKCRVPQCVNPFHLRVASATEQMLNSNNACKLNVEKTHCKRGHELKDGNLVSNKSKKRECKTCRLEYRRRQENYQGKLPSGQRTHCPHGHEYSATNTLYIKRPNRNTTERQCKACKRIRSNK